MAAKPIEVTPNYDEDTDSNVLRRMADDVHEIVHILRRIATPEAQALLDSWLSNPAVKWKARRNGNTRV